MKKNNNMYDRSVKQWNPYVGCLFDCTYCKNSFQRQLKRWGKNNCQNCYDFRPHFHIQRLYTKLPRTKGNEFIFVCSTGDISFCPNNFLDDIIETISKYKNRTFLLQSKNPYCFERLLPLPNNIILGTTIETDIVSLAGSASLAPATSERFYCLSRLDHPRKMVSVEPIMKFNLNILLSWILLIKPEFVYVGYDTVGSSFPQPTIVKAMKLVRDLKMHGIVVICKKLSGNLFNN